MKGICKLIVIELMVEATKSEMDMNSERDISQMYVVEIGLCLCLYLSLFLYLLALVRDIIAFSNFNIFI